MVADLKEVQAAVKAEMTDAYKTASEAFQKSGDFDAMMATFADLDVKVAASASVRAEKMASEEKELRTQRDKLREDYGTTLLGAFKPLWTSALSTQLKKVAELNPALRFVSIQIDINRTTEGEGDSAKAVTAIADPRAFISMSGASGGASGGSGHTRKGLELIVEVNGAQNTYKSVNAGAKALLNATANMNKETAVPQINKLAGHRVLSIGGKTVTQNSDGSISLV